MSTRGGVVCSFVLFVSLVLLLSPSLLSPFLSLQRCKSCLEFEGEGPAPSLSRVRFGWQACPFRYACRGPYPCSLALAPGGSWYGCPPFRLSIAGSLHCLLFSICPKWCAPCTGVVRLARRPCLIALPFGLLESSAVVVPASVDGCSFWPTVGAISLVFLEMADSGS